MEDISSSDEEVSSMEAACSEAPSASDWLAEDTWPEAEATWSAASLRCLTEREIGTVMLREKKVTATMVSPRKMTPMSRMTLRIIWAEERNSASSCVMATLHVVYSTGAKPAIFLVPWYV